MSGQSESSWHAQPGLPLGNEADCGQLLSWPTKIWSAHAVTMHAPRHAPPFEGAQSASVEHEF
jgi:hypothetical protein